MAIRAEFRNHDEIKKELTNLEKDAAKGVAQAIKDMGKRSGGVNVAARAAIPEVYNVKPSEVSKKRRGYDVVGNTVVSGVKIPSIVIKYESDRTYTPINFGMKPASAPTRRSRIKYPITWQPLKAGGQIPLRHSGSFPPFVATSREGTNLPWVRTQQKSWRKVGNEWKHTPLQVVHTHLSVPQMLDNEKVRPDFDQDVMRRIEKELSRVFSD